MRKIPSTSSRVASGSYAIPMPIPSAPSSSPRRTRSRICARSASVDARSTARSCGSSVPVSCITRMRAGNSPELAPKLISAFPSRAAYQEATGETPTSISSAVVTPSRALSR